MMMMADGFDVLALPHLPLNPFKPNRAIGMSVQTNTITTTTTTTTIVAMDLPAAATVISLTN